MSLLPASADPQPPDAPVAALAAEGRLDDYLELGLSKDGVKAFLKVKQYDPKVLTLQGIKAFLSDNRIVSGVRPDEEI